MFPTYRNCLSSSARTPLSTSLKPEAFVLESTPNLIPAQISFEGYRQLGERIDLTRLSRLQAFAEDRAHHFDEDGEEQGAERQEQQH